MKGVSEERLRELYSYDPLTGLITRKITRGIFKAGEVAGTTNRDGYVMINCNGKLYRGHRLAWFFVHGSFPKEQVDHINRNPSDNRIANLRLVWWHENAANSGAHCDNTSGFKGVTFLKDVRRFPSQYQARIFVRGKRISLGYFKHPEDAHAAYLAAAKKYFGEYAVSA